MTRSVGLKLDDTLAYDYGRSQTATNAEAVETSERAEHSGDRGQRAFSPGPQVLCAVVELGSAYTTSFCGRAYGALSRICSGLPGDSKLTSGRTGQCPKTISFRTIRTNAGLHLD